MVRPTDVVERQRGVAIRMRNCMHAVVKDSGRIRYLSYVYSKQPIFVLTQEWLREVWSPWQGICLFTPYVGYYTSPGIDTR